MLNDIQDFGRPPKMDRILIFFGTGMCYLVSTMVVALLIAKVFESVGLDVVITLILLFPLIISFGLCALFGLGVWKVFTRRNGIEMTLNLYNLMFERFKIRAWVSYNYEWIGIDLIDQSIQGDRRITIGSDNNTDRVTNLTDTIDDNFEF